MTEKAIALTVNGTRHSLLVKPWRTLLEVLREQLLLTGAKEGCGEGDCGACTVLLDGELVNSCLVLAAGLDGAEVLTVEGLADGTTLHRVQEAFVAQTGLQCGFCTPGMLIAAKRLLDESPDPTEDEIRVGLSGNICRCTGYAKIFESVVAAARALREES